MAGHRYTAKDRSVRRRVRNALVEENLRTGQKRKVGKREIDLAVKRQLRDEIVEPGNPSQPSPSGEKSVSGKNWKLRRRPEPRVRDIDERWEDVEEARLSDEASEAGEGHANAERRGAHGRVRLRDEPRRKDESALEEASEESAAEEKPAKEKSASQRPKRLHEVRRLEHEESIGSETSPQAQTAARKKRQRSQAEDFREAEKEAAAVVESIEAVSEQEVVRDTDLRSARRQSRLNHSDDANGMIRGAGRIARRGLQIAAAPAKHYVQREMAEADQDNAAIQSIESGMAASRRTANVLEVSMRQANVRSGVRRKEKAAEAEKRKKDEIRAFQKKKRVQAAAAARKSESTASAGGFMDSARSAFSIPKKAKQAAQSFFSEHKGTFIGFGVLGILFVLIAVSVSSCAAAVQGGGTTIIETTYSSLDEDIYAAENAYCAMEDVLNAQINAFERTHPGYDEYNYQIDEIGHNPYHLISYLQVKYGGFVYNAEIEAELNSLFSQQYRLAVSETSETRTRMETVIEQRTVIDPQTGEVTVVEVEVEQEVEYEHRIIYAVLTNKYLDMLARNSLTAEQAILYDTLNRTYGNRPYLFDLNSIDSGGSAGINYTIPPEALSDEKFRNMIIEAEKYLGYPYVWGGKSPRTSFDCSGFVCWVINHCANDWNVGQKRAKELCRMCIYVSPSEARPGDLIFFEKTYDTDGASHVGIYVGDGVMLHCGNPIKYSNINTRYYKEHFLCFGRLPFYDD